MLGGGWHKEDELITAGYGFGYFPARIPPSQVTLANGPPDEPAHASPAGGTRKAAEEKPRAYQ